LITILGEQAWSECNTVEKIKEIEPKLLDRRRAGAGKSGKRKNNKVSG